MFSLPKLAESSTATQREKKKLFLSLQQYLWQQRMHPEMLLRQREREQLPLLQL